MTHLLRAVLPSGARKEFSPEAYGDFPIVQQEEIDALRKRMAERTADDEWEVLQDVIGG